MKPKRQLSAEAIQAAVTRGQPQERKLPDTIPLKTSQVVALNAIHQNRQRLTKQIQECNAALEVDNKLQVDVLNEVMVEHKITMSEISNFYQYDGKQLINVAAVKPKE